MGFVLSLLAITLMFITHIVDYFVSLFYDVKNRKWFKLVDKRNFKKAFRVDVFANYQYSDFWNLIWSKKGDNYKYGRKGETLSSVFGKKQLEQSLSIIGWFFLILINLIDVSKWFKRGHCIASIMTNEQIENNLKF